MKNTLFIIIFALIGVTTTHTATAQNYDPFDVQVINNLIANNGLGATPNDPDSWWFAKWNNENPKQIIDLRVEEWNLKGAASFAGLTALQRLGCFRNKLTRLDLTACLQLEEISCSSNLLTEIDLTYCEQIKELYCSNNHLTKLDLSNHIQLETLHCDKNRLTKLDVTHYTQLQSLDCSDNELTELDVSKCTQLTRLLCGRNKLTELNVNNCVQLSQLSCCSTKLRKFDVKKCSELKVFWCSENELTELELRAYGLVTYGFGGQNPHLTLFEKVAGEYTHSILLNHPTFENSNISYLENVLKSTDKTVDNTEFTVQVIGNSKYQLSGTMHFTYSNLGIPPQEKMEWKLYPNPTTGEITITNYELRITKIEVFDVYGRKVGAKFLSNALEGTVIDISSLAAGVYLVKIATVEGETVRKIVRQ